MTYNLPTQCVAKSESGFPEALATFYRKIIESGTKFDSHRLTTGPDRDIWCIQRDSPMGARPRVMEKMCSSLLAVEPRTSPSIDEL